MHLLDTFLDYLPAWPVSMVFVSAILAGIFSILTMTRAASWLLLFSLCSAWLTGVVTLAGLASSLLMIGLAAGFQRAQTIAMSCISGMSLFVVAVLALLHALPGFHNPMLFDGVQISAISLPYSLYLNYDKLLLAVVLLLFVVPVARPVSLKALSGYIGGFALLSGLCLTIALQSGLVRVELKLPEITLLWILCNLWVTCFAEEAFFRGFIQQQMQGWLKRPYWPWLVVVISGGLFGLAHFPAGASYVLIATLLGSYYAYCYQRSQHILLPIGLHFGFNCLHFFAFSYPLLQP